MSDQKPLFIPGPTNIPNRLWQAMHVQTCDHRAPFCVDLTLPVQAVVKEVFGTDSARILLFPASGTRGWEAAITNTLSVGDKVLMARNGVFSHQWIDLCQRHGLKVQVIDCAWGNGSLADKIEVGLTADAGQQIKAVLITHNETAIGVRFDIASIRDVMDGATHLALLFVDCFSSLASKPIAMDEWGVDIAVAGPQKGFKLVASSPNFYSDTVSAILTLRGFDNNLLTQHSFNGYGVSFGVGHGELNGKAFRIAHLGSLTEVMVLSGLATMEMVMADLDYPIELGSRVAAAPGYFRESQLGVDRLAA